MNSIEQTFDRIASNTGHVIASCITLQQRICALLCSVCCHHVEEATLTRVFNDLNIEASLDQHDMQCIVNLRR